jgi:indole-3-glycerol phosphate synthase
VSILDKILATKRDEIAAAKQLSLPTVPSRGRRSLISALRRPAGERVRVLSEIKRASPSAGPIRPQADPVEIARAYDGAGASAISVLTDRTYFDGDLMFLAPVRAAVAVPVLRKDFLIDPFQIAETAAYGADALLLIVAALSPDLLELMLRETHAYKLEALVEVHSLAELDVALARGAEIIGVNHRNLATFEIDMTLTEQVAKCVPAGTVLVAESGIKTADDVRRLGDVGAHAVLVGETLMRAASPGEALKALWR